MARVPKSREISHAQAHEHKVGRRCCPILWVVATHSPRPSKTCATDVCDTQQRTRSEKLPCRGEWRGYSRTGYHPC